jgi:hypothetical protein
LVKDVQPSNTPETSVKESFPSESMAFGITIEVKLLQPLKMEFPRLVMD